MHYAGDGWRISESWKIPVAWDISKDLATAGHLNHFVGDRDGAQVYLMLSNDTIDMYVSNSRSCNGPHEPLQGVNFIS